jgi:8-oxo-dGTP pyrophosphatase MutT (NUDIX family)
MTAISANLVTVIVFRRGPEVEFLQLLREREPLKGTWQPVAGRIEEIETAAKAGLRELREETGLTPSDPEFLGLWKLDGVHPYYLPSMDVVMLSPTLAVEAGPAWRPRLNAEHSDARWAPASKVGEMFMWGAHEAACREVIERVLAPGSLSEPAQRLDPRAVLSRPPIGQA